MAGKSDKVVVSVIDGLTSTQASNITAAISKAKNKYAPNSRGTGAITTRENVGKLLHNKIKQIGR